MVDVQLPLESNVSGIDQIVQMSSKQKFDLTIKLKVLKLIKYLRMKLIEIAEGSTLPENVIYYNRNGYTHGIQFEEADIEVYWTDLIKQAEKLANKVGDLHQRNCFWEDVSNYIKPKQSHINWTKVYNHNLKDCKSINNVKSIFFKGNFKGWNLTGIVDSWDRTKFYLEHMGNIWVDESGSYNNQGEPRFDGQ